MAGIIEKAYIGLGSNLGDSLHILLNGWESLGAIPGISLERLSSPYRTEPVGMASQNWFVNAAGSVFTSLSPDVFLAELLGVEALFGRKRADSGGCYQDRSLDLDLLLYGAQVRSEPGLEIPHPLLHKRLFVLAPLREIAPKAIHPVGGETVRRLCEQLLRTPNQPVVERIAWPG